ncbi:hypothetical protein E4631_18660 [Hymenobacter sp. UV11]|uniref:hypothetical protein n=1 Tax=Hymenobacter sp. UV11 TaxID=1849735 RepID=UPI0010622163|nr:hypothetical protein [Hymenobacter sp. UV11]TDN36440.1 hypothetical protein A8B98_08760 [Hymenobacter sp. UV11]TFZ64540.1 hypothetical protein E4631_18660 [Hymenobacter sp. UV11]
MKPVAQDPLAQLTEIRAIMERSSRFLSLSGLSGVGAGVVALAGTAIGHYYLEQQYGAQGYQRLFQTSEGERLAALPFLLGLAVAMILAALLVAAFFTLRRTRRDGLRSLWTAPARRLLLALLVPLVAGGLFCLQLFLSGAPELVVPGLLVFYGLALLNGGKYTLDEIKYLGLTLVALGLIALLLPGYGLLLFGAGFGLGHIGYGLLMYNRYERPVRAKAGKPNFAP